jgi:hypothetical protein
MFNALRSLGLVRLSQAAFLAADARARARSSDAKPPMVQGVSGWKRGLRIAFELLFLLAWLEGLALVYEIGSAFAEGARTPTSVYSQSFEINREIRYITPEQRRIIDLLLLAMIVTMPPAVVGMLGMRFVMVRGVAFRR